MNIEHVSWLKNVCPMKWSIEIYNICNIYGWNIMKLYNCHNHQQCQNSPSRERYIERTTEQELRAWLLRLWIIGGVKVQHGLSDRSFFFFCRFSQDICLRELQFFRYSRYYVLAATFTFALFTISDCPKSVVAVTYTKLVQNLFMGQIWLGEDQ